MKENLINNKMRNGNGHKEGKPPIEYGSQHKILRLPGPLAQTQAKQGSPHSQYNSHVEVGNIQIAVHAIVKRRKNTSRNENINARIIKRNRD